MRKNVFLVSIFAAFAFIFMGCQQNPVLLDIITNYGISPTSQEGRLSLEPVEGGIKVTVRVLENDETPDAMDNFTIREKKSGIMLDLEKPVLNGKPREVSGIFPFVNENEKYEFEFLLSMSKAGQEVCPYHVEEASCKATSTGLKLRNYFNSDYSPVATKVILTDEGYLSIDRDIKDFFKQEPVSLYLEGGIFAGTRTPWNAEWVDNWLCNIKGYSEYIWQTKVGYDSLTSTTGFNLGGILRWDSGKLTKLKNKDGWFTNGTLSFSFENIETKFKIGLIEADEISTDLFNANDSLPPSVGENPFVGKNFSYTDSYNSRVEYKFITNETMERYRNGELSTQYKYTYNARTNKLNLSTEKISMSFEPGDYRFMNKEEFIQSIEQIIVEDALPGMGFNSKEEYIQVAIEVYFQNIQLSCEITASGCNFTGEIGEYKNYLYKGEYEDTDAYYTCTSNTYTIRCSSLKMGDAKYFYVAKVTDNEITYNPGENLGEPSFTVQYVYNSNNDTFTLTGVPGFDSPLVFTAHHQTVATTVTFLN